jgi:hypothetical protein
MVHKSGAARQAATSLAGYWAAGDNFSMSTPLDSPAPPREPHLLKFRLRQLFLWVTVLSVLFAVIAATDGPWPWIIVILALMVAAHVFGNLIGTRLRDTSEDVVRWRNSDPRQTSDYPQMTPQPCDMGSLPMPPETNLRNFGRMIRGMRWFLLAGLLVGLAFGGTVLWLTIGYRIGWAGWIVGTISGAVLGTWIAFLAVSFTTISRDALRQMHGREG